MSLILTQAQNFRINNTQFDGNEFRVTNAGLLNAFKMQSDAADSWLTPELKAKAMAGMGRDTKISNINYKDVTIRTTRPLTIAADENTSTFYTITWTTVAYGFAMYPTQHYNNEIDEQRDFDAKMKAAIVKLTSTLESQAFTAVDTDKTQVVNQVTGGHTFASNVVSETGISTFDNSYILHDLGPMMMGNDYEPSFMDVVGNQQFHAIVNRMNGYGGFNQEDKTIMFLNKRFGWSNTITNAALKDATGFAIPSGTLGVLIQIEPDSLLNTSLKTGHEWGTIVMPGLELPFGTYTYEAAVDLSGGGAHLAHLERTGARFVDFAADFAFITKYSSNRATIPGPIIKFDIALA